MTVMENRNYRSTARRIKLDPKNTVKNMKLLKYSIYLTTKKNTTAVSSTQRIQISKFNTRKSTPLIPVCLAAISPKFDKFSKI